ncbi:MAG: hypothetical protein RIK87_11475 [Fuerstiella sp.]
MRRLVPTLLILALSCWTIRPVLTQITSALPIRENHLITVPLFNAWTIWWNADCMRRGFSGYWDAPIFFPEQGTLAYSEPQPATTMVAPVVWLTGSPAAAYNVYLLLSLFLNGFFTYVILRRHGARRPMATIGGAMMLWLPISLRQLEVVQLVPVWPMLWTWDAMRRHGTGPSRRTAAELAAAYAVCFYTSIHHTLFLSVVLAGTGWILFRTVRQSLFWKTSAACVLLAAIPVGAVLVPMQQTLSEQSFERSRKLVTDLSAIPQDLFLTPSDALFFGTSNPGFGMSPGWLKMVLAGLGCLLGLCRRRHRRWVLFLLLTAVVSGLLALGPNLKIGPIQPWWTLADWCPGMSQVRNVFRFAYLTQMAVLLLSVTALSQLWVRLRASCKRPRIASGIVTVLGLLALAETPPPTLLLAGVPDLERHSHWTTFVRQQTPAGMGIACLPFAPGTKASDFAETTRWMYYGTLHKVPLVNGYSGFFPATYMELRADITEQGLTDDILTRFSELQTHFLVVRRAYELPAALMEKKAGVRLELVFSDEVGIDVYELRR